MARGGTTSSGQCSPTSIINQENAPPHNVEKKWLQASLIGLIVSIDVPFSHSWCQFQQQQQQHNQHNRHWLAVALHVGLGQCENSLINNEIPIVLSFFRYSLGNHIVETLWL